MHRIHCNALYVLIVLIITNVSCLKQPHYLSPQGYDLEHPVKVFLPDELNEISGIIFYPKDTSVFAISDATGSLYKIYPDRNVQVQKWKFGTNHDYEDLQRVDSTFYVLSSSGDIVSINFSRKDSMRVSEFQISDKEKNEFEALYYDSASHQLILVCKDCKEDKKNTVSTHAFNIDSGTYNSGPFKIDVKQIDKILNIEKMKFKPSAAAINPVTHELFILASVNKELVIANKKGSVKSVYALRPSLYKQPEGIAFTPRGDLLISNESAKEGSAEILVIKYKK